MVYHYCHPEGIAGMCTICTECRQWLAIKFAFVVTNRKKCEYKSAYSMVSFFLCQLPGCVFQWGLKQRLYHMEKYKYYLQRTCTIKLSYLVRPHSHEQPRGNTIDPPPKHRHAAAHGSTACCIWWLLPLPNMTNSSLWSCAETASNACDCSTVVHLQE